MKFLIDNSLSPKLALALRDMGHDAVHLLDYGMADASDEDVVLRAEAEDRVVVAADMDFPMILALGGRRKPSLMIFRHNVRSRLRQIARLKESLGNLESWLREGVIATFTNGSVRLRKLPVGWRTVADD